MRVAQMRPSETTAALSTAQLTDFLEADPADAFLHVFERHGTLEHATPERALAFAILLDACDELLKTPPNQRRYAKFQETFAWFMSDERDYPLYMRNLCDHFGFDADDLRRGMHALLLAREQNHTVPHLKPRRSSAYSRQRGKIGGRS